MREKINAEKAPLLKAMRTAEDRIIAAETEISRMDVSDEQAQENRRRLLKEFDSLRKNFNYLDSVAGDSLKALRDGGLPPGEAKAKMERLDEIQHRLDSSTSSPDGKAGLAVAGFLLDQLKESLGGYTAQGRALVAMTSR